MIGISFEMNYESELFEMVLLKAQNMKTPSSRLIK